MTDPGLSHRLRQHSRRTGIMVGVTMALTIAVCIGGFAGIYAQLGPYTADFVAEDVPTAIRRPDPLAATAPLNRGIATSSVAESIPTSANAASIVEPQATNDPDEFTQTHVSNPVQNVNLRSVPSAAGGGATVVRVLPASTPLDFLDDEAPTQNPSVDGDSWMFFQTEDGDKGWIREIDTQQS